MSRLKNRLTAKAVASAGPGRHADGAGLILEVTARGAKSWLFRYKIAGRERWMGLGPASEVSLAQARDRADAARKVLVAGRDPMEAKAEIEVEQKRVGRTVAQAADAFVKAKSPGWRPRMVGAVESLVRTMKAPGAIGEKSIASLTTEEVVEWIQPIWHRTPPRASKMRGLLAQIVSYGEAMGWRDGRTKNPAGWETLQHALPRAKAVRPVVHFRGLLPAEVPAWWSAFERIGGAGAECLRLIALTGARHTEAAHATWDEFALDGSEPMWTIPAARMKGKRDHHVPLSAPAVMLLRRMLAVRRGDLVFSGILAKRPISSTTMAVALKRLGGEWHARLTPHGLRSSLRGWCAENGVAAEVAELLLAHAQPGLVAAYQRQPLLEQRRAALEAWAMFVTGGAPRLRAIAAEAVA